jgi:8-oxo-dGTP diphosphatase
MPHTHDQPGQHDLTVSMYVINTAEKEPRALLHMHRVLGLLMQPGGHVELNESPWAAVAHELLEETGYELDQLLVLQPTPLLVSEDDLAHPVPLLFNTSPFPAKVAHHHTNLTYAFVTEQQPRHAVGAEESDTLQWLSMEELAALPAGSCFPDVPGIYNQLLASWDAWSAIPANSYAI